MYYSEERIQFLGDACKLILPLILPLTNLVWATLVKFPPFRYPGSTHSCSHCKSRVLEPFPSHWELAYRDLCYSYSA